MNANLLVDKVFKVELLDGTSAQISLPVLLELYGTGGISALASIQRHQSEPLHAFLCSIAGAALLAADRTSVIQPESFWTKWLRVLGGQAEWPWTLIVDDPSKPAFMQPPVPEFDGLASFKPKARTPDELDILQTAKNHDVKSARVRHATTEQWTYALISTQTASGFLGQGNYGICRMNGGFGSRSFVSVTSDVSVGGRWREDTERLLSQISSLLPPSRPYTMDGHLLLWTVPWDGIKGLGLDELHPFFVEVCRRIRLVRVGHVTRAIGRPTKSTRITVAKETKGNVGDPWTPIRRDGESALTMTGSGFTPRLLRDLIVAHQEYHASSMQSLPTDSHPSWFRAACLVRGQGKTDGFHEVEIRIEPRVKQLLLAGGKERDVLANLSERGIEVARSIGSKVLRPAVFCLIEGGPDGWPDTSRKQFAAWVQTWMQDYASSWRALYFPWLWRTVRVDEDSALGEWLAQMRMSAEDVFRDAIAAAPQRSGRRFRAKARATALFYGSFERHFGEEMINV